MNRTILVLLIGWLLVLLSACGGTTSLEPTAPALDSHPAPQVRETVAAGETDAGRNDDDGGQPPAKPAIVDFGEVDGGDENEVEEEPMEAPAPGGRGAETQLVEQARQALAARLDLTLDEVTVRSMEEVTWPDSALGCPAPDMMYLQVLTPGFRIVLEAAGSDYTYHTNRTDQIVLCGPDGRPLD